MKRFYMLLGGIAVVGGGAMYVASGRSGEVRVAAPRSPSDTMAMPGWVAGSDSAPVEIEEWADFQCPACQRMAVLTVPDVMERLVKTGRVRWRFRDFPLPMHQNSIPAHEAAACAGEQGGFWLMHDQIYYNQSDWAMAGNAPRKMRELAQKVGVDLPKYDECIKEHRYLERIMASAREGARRGVNSTPTLIIRDQIIGNVLSYDEVKALIEKATPKKQS